MKHGAGLILILLVLAAQPVTVSALTGDLPGLAAFPAAEAETLRADLKSLGTRLRALLAAGKTEQQLADAELFHKAVLWGLSYEANLSASDLALIRRALTRGRERAEALSVGRTPWAVRKGRLVRGYVSAVDGSTQPYGLIVPAGYDPSRPMRLDVVLHGSSRPLGMSELRFLAPFDEGDAPGQGPDEPFLELRPLGRVENCYRWAGETDVFEALEAVCRDYRVDRDRIVLRGMSMGASGTWHLGLKHPDRFVALGPYCGYVDTHEFSKSPMPNFVLVGPLPPHQEQALHMLDSVDYAANAGVVPAIAAMGEKDPFFQAHVLMGSAMEREGLKMLNLISPGTAHVQDPPTFAEQMRRIDVHAARGLDRRPRRLRFVTWTLKYNRCHWLELLALKEHYARAELDAEIGDDGAIRVREPVNVRRFALLPEALGKETRLRVGEREVPLPKGEADRRGGLVFERRRDGWACAGSREALRLRGKRPGLQGPIDDAFSAPFLCVRGTGNPWNPKVGEWANAALDRFAYEWRRYFRGDLPVKDDTEVTAEDLRTRNLVLFGDPGSNRWIARARKKLPIDWTRDSVRIGEQRYPAADHAPVLICANPLPGSEGRYLVINSGHTFHEKELASLNYLLFPRLGDWAVMRLGAEEPVRAGFFNEEWRLDEVSRNAYVSAE